MSSGARIQRGAVALAALRIWVFGLWTVKLFATPVGEIGLLPRAMFEPIGLLRLFPGSLMDVVLAQTFLDVARPILIGLCVAVALALPPYRVLSVTAALGLTLWQTLSRSVGVVNHPEVTLLLATYAIVIFPAADRLAPLRRRLHDASTYDAGVLVAALVVLLPYTASAGYRMAHHAWATLHSQIAPDLLLRQGFGNGVAWFAEVALTHPLVAAFINLGAVVTTLIEFAAPLAIVHRRLRWPIATFMVTFHVLMYLLIRVMFWETALLVPAVLLAVQMTECSEGTTQS